MQNCLNVLGLVFINIEIVYPAKKQQKTSFVRRQGLILDRMPNKWVPTQSGYRKEMFYLTVNSTHFIYGYMVSHI